MMKPGEMVTVLARTTRLRGDLECEGELQIDGDFKGSIRQTGGRVIVGPESQVHAHIIAQDVIVMGKVEGDIRATGRVELRSTAVVTGDVFAGRLSMEENAMLHGQVDPSRASEREIPVQEYAAPQLVERPAPVVERPAPVVAREPVYEQPAPVAPRPTLFEPMYEQPEFRPSEHRQALPLREESSASHRAVPVAQPAERQLPSVLAAFAPGGSRDISERGARAVTTRNDKMWHNSDTE